MGLGEKKLLSLLLIRLKNPLFNMGLGEKK